MIKNNKSLYSDKTIISIFKTIFKGSKEIKQNYRTELKKTKHLYEFTHPIKVKYKGAIVGEYFADLFVDNKVLVELKIAKDYNPHDELQLLN